MYHFSRYTASIASASGNSSSLRRLPKLLQMPLPHSKAAAHQHYQPTGRKVWSRSPRYERTSLLAPDILLSSSRTLLSPSQTHQPCHPTHHIPLAAFLHKIGVEDSPICPFCHESPETIAHYIIHCPVHRLARVAMFAGLHPSSHSLTTLLSSTKNLPRLLTFIARTDRLRSVYGRIAETSVAAAA